MEVHARLARSNSAYSSIQEIAVKLTDSGESTTVLFDGAKVKVDDSLVWFPWSFIVGSGDYKLEEMTGGSGPNGPRRRSLKYMNGTLFKLSSTDGDLVISVSSSGKGGGCGEECGDEGADKADGAIEYNMSFTIDGTSYYLGDSVGLCGDYDDGTNNGIFARDGTPKTLPNLYPGYAYSLNATALGDDWQVSSLTDPTILDSDTATILAAQGRWSQTECVRYVDHSASVTRSLELAAGEKCKRCEEIENNMLARLNCYYDADVMGCETSDFNNLYDVVYSEEAPIQIRLQKGALESPTCTYAASILNPKTPKAGKAGKTPKASKSPKGENSDDERRLSAKSSRSITKCEEMGGECVVQCNSATHQCVSGNGLCEVDVYGRDTYPVQTGSFYNGCSCKIDKAPIDRVLL